MYTLRTIERTAAGRRHEYHGKPNEDAVRTTRCGNILCISVNDGCSSAEYGAKAAEINARCAELAAANPMMMHLSQRDFIRKMAEIYDTQLATSGYPLDELCATTAFLLVDRETGCFVTFSVGDSAIMAADENLYFRRLLSPINGIRKNSTVFTNHSGDVCRHAQYSQGRLSPGLSVFLLYTDGAAHLAEVPFSSAQQLTASLLLSHSAAADCADTLLQQSREINPDDVSFAVAALENEVTVAAARSVYCGRLPELEDEENEPAPILPEVQPDDMPAAGKTRKAVFPFLRRPADEPAYTPADETALPPLLRYLQKPRTAGELVRAGLGITPDTLVDSVLVLLRLGLITVEMQGKTAMFTSRGTAA